jgi:glycerol kinase
MPIHNAIVWQDRRTAELCRELADQGHEDMVAGRTGLRLDPYFSATKLAWILDRVPDAREAANAGHIAFGTVDSFLIWRLTGGRLHVTDITNASRTALFDIRTGRWDPELCALFRVPVSCLPEVRDSAGDFGFADRAVLGENLPICGVAGDQQAALIGQACFAAGDVKSTYGTGAFMVLNTGDHMVRSKNRLLSTVAYRLDGHITYALEGSILSAGSTVQWLRDGLGLIARAAETEALARSVPDAGGVYLVPAFTGLGAPYWDPDARGLVTGLSRASGRAELARAALDSVAYQTRDLLDAMAADGVTPASLKVDGGMAENPFLLQRLADITGSSCVPASPKARRLAPRAWRDWDEVCSARWPKSAGFGSRQLVANLRWPRPTVIASWQDGARRCAGPSHDPELPRRNTGRAAELSVEGRQISESAVVGDG